MSFSWRELYHASPHPFGTATVRQPSCCGALTVGETLEKWVVMDKERIFPWRTRNSTQSDLRALKILFFQLLIIGNSSVGKTSFLFRYCDDSFTSAFVSTVGIDFKVSLLPSTPDYFIIFPGENCFPRREESKAANMGHSRPGEVPYHHNGLLPRSHGLHPDVWHHQWGVLQRRTGLVRATL